MVLVGISVLVASISFLVYCHPPTSWPSISGLLLRLWYGRRLTELGNISELKTAAARCDDREPLATHSVSPNKSLLNQEVTSGPRLSVERNASPSPQSDPEATLVTPHNSTERASYSLEESSSSGGESPPSFPSKYSAQRTSLLPSVTDRSRQTPRSSPLTNQTTGSTSMAPPLRPISTLATVRTRDWPTASSLSVPAGTGSLPARSGGNSLALPPTATQKPVKPRKRVLLTPGHSPLDWARLQASGADLRGLPHPHLLRVSPSQLRLHNKRTNAWSVLGGKVYNITPYLPFHPGGEGELMKAAGRDGTKLFMEIHPWVNWDTMLGGCLIGMAVDEDSVGAAGGNGNDMDIVGKKWENVD